MRARVWLTICLVLALAAGAGAEEAGALRGIVTVGADRAPVAGATVTLRGSGYDRAVTTNPDGAYEFDGVPAGSAYTIAIEADGFEPFARADVGVAGDGRSVIDVVLRVGDRHYAVEVTGTAARPLSVEVSQRIDEDQIENLPSITRSTIKYALLSPNVRQGIGLGADFQDAQRLSINAGSYRHTGFLLDGLSTYDWIYGNGPQTPISPSAVREVRVLTGQYPASYGLSTTGVVAIATASGGERLRGETFAFFRPSDLQARPPGSTMDVPNERTDWGATVGGPLGIGGTRFFATFERIQQDRGAYIQSPSPGFFTGESRDRLGLVRIDGQRSGHLLSVRGNGSESTATNANDRVAGFNQASYGRRSRTWSGGGQVTDRVVSGRFASELRASYVEYLPDSASPLQSSVQVVRPNYATEGYSTVNSVRARTAQGGYQLMFTQGRHQLTMGGDLGWLRAKDYSATPLGTYTFAPGGPVPGEHPLTYSQTFGVSDLRYGQVQGSAFIQDDLRPLPTLTVSLGLRYEAQSITDSRTNFGPRVGVAWDVDGSRRTMVRAGAGLFFDQYYMYLTRRYISLGPQSPQTSYTWNWGDPGFPSFPDSFTALPGSGLSPARDIMIPPDRLLNPFARQFSVAVERDLGRGMLLEVTGVASHTFRQMRVNDINHPAPFVRTAANQVRTPQVANLSRPFTTYEGVVVRDIARIDNTAESIYRSLGLGLTKRLAGGQQFSANYAWSSSIAYSMFYADANSGVPNEWLDDDSFERGPGDFHQPHRIVVTTSSPLAFGVQGSAVLVAASGLPVNPVTGRDNNGDSYNVDRPIGLGRNSFRGPAQFNLDVAVSRRIRLAGRWSTEVRMEIFNLTNRSNFLRVNNVYGEGPSPLPTFLAPVSGITNADPARQLQFAWKVLF